MLGESLFKKLVREAVDYNTKDQIAHVNLRTRWEAGA